MIQQQGPSPQPFDKLKLMESFEALEDPRRRLASCDYPLQELLLTALCAISSGADDWVDVGLWGSRSSTGCGDSSRLRTALPRTTPSAGCSLLDANCFEACFIDWMECLCPSLRGHVIHIDGKSLRGSHNGCEAMAHLVSAWDSAVGVTLGQVKTANKSNEITAIPQLLNLLVDRTIAKRPSGRSGMANDGSMLCTFNF